MKTQYSLGQKAKRALTGLAFLASSILPLGCATQYSSDVKSGIEENSFSSADFSSNKSQRAFSHDQYVFGNKLEDIVDGNDKIKREDNNSEIKREDMLPEWAVRNSKMAEIIDPKQQKISYRELEGDKEYVRVFVRIDKKYVTLDKSFTEIKAKPDTMSEVPHANFDSIKGIPMSINGEEKELKYVVIDSNTRNPKLALVLNPQYILNRQSGKVELKGKVYIETRAYVEKIDGNGNPLPDPTGILR